MNVALMRRMEWRGELARIETDTAAPLGSHDVSAGLNLLSHCRFASCAHQDGERRAGPSIRAITTQVGTPAQLRRVEREDPAMTKRTGPNFAGSAFSGLASSSTSCADQPG